VGPLQRKQGSHCTGAAAAWPPKPQRAAPNHKKQERQRPNTAPAQTRRKWGVKYFDFFQILINLNVTFFINKALVTNLS
jgi:hypothetical protein